MKKKVRSPENAVQYTFQGYPTPSLRLRNSVRMPQCGRARNYSLGAQQGGAGDSLSRVLIMKSGQTSPLL